MTDQRTPQDAARALLPGLQFLALEARHAGLPDISRVLVDALHRIAELIDGGLLPSERDGMSTGLQTASAWPEARSVAPRAQGSRTLRQHGRRSSRKVHSEHKS